jgi:hypothetical protein
MLCALELPNKLVGLGFDRLAVLVEGALGTVGLALELLTAFLLDRVAAVLVVYLDTLLDGFHHLALAVGDGGFDHLFAGALEACGLAVGVGYLGDPVGAVAGNLGAVRLHLHRRFVFGGELQVAVGVRTFNLVVSGFLVAMRDGGCSVVVPVDFCDVSLIVTNLEALHLAVFPDLGGVRAGLGDGLGALGVVEAVGGAVGVNLRFGLATSPVLLLEAAVGLRMVTCLVSLSTDT